MQWQKDILEGEAFGETILGLSHELSPECFAPTPNLESPYFVLSVTPSTGLAL
jgi:hypothetical protein